MSRKRGLEMTKVYLLRESLLVTAIAFIGVGTALMASSLAFIGIGVALLAGRRKTRATTALTPVAEPEPLRASQPRPIAQHAA
jgi:hypothetical protein